MFVLLDIICQEKEQEVKYVKYNWIEAKKNKEFFQMQLNTVIKNKLKDQQRKDLKFTQDLQKIKNALG